jgi:hypothetical protein
MGMLKSVIYVGYCVYQVLQIDLNCTASRVQKIYKTTCLPIKCIILIFYDT